MSGDHTKYHGTAEVPKREWVDLTNHEIHEIADIVKPDLTKKAERIRFAQEIQKKFKEKNT